METYEFSRSFSLGAMLVSPVHVRIEELRPVIAAHTHSNTSYEIHYAERGAGTVTIDGETHPVTADTLYITGPRVVHAQASPPETPVTEYCLYLDCRRVSAAPGDPFALFIDTAFWMGRDEGRVYPLLKRLIEENGLALWDTVGSCLREGSLDSGMRGIRPNDFDAFFARYPHIRTVLCNGKTAYDLFSRTGAGGGRTVLRMPSTSPAYTLPYAEKEEIWLKALRQALG